MVALADRADDKGFCVHDTVTPPDPVPLACDTVSHDPFPDAVQLPPVQPTGEPVTVTLVEFAPDPGFAELGLIEKVVQVLLT